MKNLSRIGILIGALFFISQAVASPTISRDTSYYNLGGYALFVVTTYPVQANEPVYAWRTHTRFDGTNGTLGYNETFIGYTNNRGILNVVVQTLPHDGIYCGYFSNEKVAVGYPSNKKSNILYFTINDGLPHAGPRHPPNGCDRNQRIIKGNNR